MGPWHSTRRELQPLPQVVLDLTRLLRRERKNEAKESKDVSFLQGFQAQDRALTELEERVRMLQEVVKDQVREGDWALATT